jgi:hypothetical protein
MVACSVAHISPPYTYIIVCFGAKIELVVVENDAFLTANRVQGQALGSLRAKELNGLEGEKRIFLTKAMVRQGVPESSKIVLSAAKVFVKFRRPGNLGSLVGPIQLAGSSAAVACFEPAKFEHP